MCHWGGGGGAWLAYSVKALSDLNKLQGGLTLDWRQVGNAPLWNSRVFTIVGQIVTCRYCGFMISLILTWQCKPFSGLSRDLQTAPSPMGEAALGFWGP